MTGHAQRQARQYRQEAKETLGTGLPSSFGTILMTPWLHALAHAPQWIHGKSGVIFIISSSPSAVLGSAVILVCAYPEALRVNA